VMTTCNRDLWPDFWTFFWLILTDCVCLMQMFDANI
jgi:hypothetical protein